jgi:hypothetical protein
MDSSNIDQIDPTLLPPQLRELVRILGMGQALRLCRAWGGQRRWIPAAPGAAADHLRALLSDESIQRLAASDFAGREVQIPRVGKAEQQLTHAAIRRDRQEGATLNTLAERYGYTTRRVQQICQDEPPTPPKKQLQLPL